MNREWIRTILLILLLALGVTVWIVINRAQNPIA